MLYCTVPLPCTVPPRPRRTVPPPFRAGRTDAVGGASGGEQVRPGRGGGTEGRTFRRVVRRWYAVPLWYGSPRWYAVPFWYGFPFRHIPPFRSGVLSRPAVPQSPLFHMDTLPHV